MQNVVVILIKSVFNESHNHFYYEKFLEKMVIYIICKCYIDTELNFSKYRN